MGSTSDRALEMVPPQWDGPGEEARGPAEEANGLRKASEAVAVVSASVLVCGGIGVLCGVALEAINPFALGMVGAVVGICLPVLLRGVIGARWRGTFGG